MKNYDLKRETSLETLMNEIANPSDNNDHGKTNESSHESVSFNSNSSNGSDSFQFSEKNIEHKNYKATSNIISTLNNQSILQNSLQNNQKQIYSSSSSSSSSILSMTLSNDEVEVELEHRKRLKEEKVKKKLFGGERKRQQTNLNAAVIYGKDEWEDWGDDDENDNENHNGNDNENETNNGSVCGERERNRKIGGNSESKIKSKTLREGKKAEQQEQSGVPEERVSKEKETENQKYQYQEQRYIKACFQAIKKHIETLVDPMTLTTINERLSERSYATMEKYYSSRPELAQYTIETELHRLKYIIHNHHTELANSSKDDISNLKQLYTNYEDCFCWRLANQSLLVDMVVEIQQEYASPALGVSILASQSQFFINVADDSLKVYVEFMVRLSGSKDIVVELATIKGHILINTKERTISHILQRPSPKLIFDETIMQHATTIGKQKWQQKFANLDYSLHEEDEDNKIIFVNYHDEYDDYLKENYSLRDQVLEAAGFHTLGMAGSKVLQTGNRVGSSMFNMMKSIGKGLENIIDEINDDDEKEIMIDHNGEKERSFKTIYDDSNSNNLPNKSKELVDNIRDCNNNNKDNPLHEDISDDTRLQSPNKTPVFLPSQMFIKGIGSGVSKAITSFDKFAENLILKDVDYESEPLKLYRTDEDIKKEKEEEKKRLHQEQKKQTALLQSSNDSKLGIGLWNNLKKMATNLATPEYDEEEEDGVPSSVQKQKLPSMPFSYRGVEIETERETETETERERERRGERTKEEIDISWHQQDEPQSLIDGHEEEDFDDDDW